jgi:hypothetical protein
MTQQPFELPTMSYPTPTSFYDMLPNDYLNMTLTNQVDSKADMGFGRPYNLPAAAGQLAPAYPTYNELPLFQTPPSFSFPSTSSSVASSMSWESPSTQPSSSLSDDLSQPTVETETEEKEVKPTAKQLGKRKRRSNSVGRIGDKIKRPAGTGFAAMFVRSS